MDILAVFPFMQRETHRGTYTAHSFKMKIKKIIFATFICNFWQLSAEIAKYKHVSRFCFLLDHFLNIT